MQVYIQAKSKKIINTALSLGATLEGVEYSMFATKAHDVASLPVGTVVKIFDRYVGGSPYAKAYGTIGRDKQGRVIVK